MSCGSASCSRSSAAAPCSARLPPSVPLSSALATRPAGSGAVHAAVAGSEPQLAANGRPMQCMTSPSCSTCLPPAPGRPAGRAETTGGGCRRCSRCRSAARWRPPGGHRNKSGTPQARPRAWSPGTCGGSRRRRRGSAGAGAHVWRRRRRRTACAWPGMGSCRLPAVAHTVCSDTPLSTHQRGPHRKHPPGVRLQVFNQQQLRLGGGQRPRADRLAAPAQGTQRARRRGAGSAGHAGGDAGGHAGAGVRAGSVRAGGGRRPRALTGMAATAPG